MVGLDGDDTGHGEERQDRDLGADDRQFDAARGRGAEEVDAEKAGNDHKPQRRRQPMGTATTGEHRRAIGAEGGGIERQGSDIAGDQKPAGDAGHDRIAEGVLDIGEAAAIVAEGKAEMGVGDAGQERHDAAEDHGDGDRVAGRLDGQAQHREDAAADHAADADGDDLGEAELVVVAAGSCHGLLVRTRAPRGSAHLHPAGACAASSAFRSTLVSATLAGGGEMPAPIMRRPRTWSAARLTESIATSRAPA